MVSSSTGLLPTPSLPGPIVTLSTPTSVFSVVVTTEEILPCPISTGIVAQAGSSSVVQAGLIILDNVNLTTASINVVGPPLVLNQPTTNLSQIKIHGPAILSFMVNFPYVTATQGHPMPPSEYVPLLVNQITKT